MKYILLDTNILIYREGEKTLNKPMQLLSRLLIDSQEYCLCIHPLSYDELSHHKSEKEKEVITSKIKTYKKLEQAPLLTEEFSLKFGKINNSHDINDITLLFMLERNCVGYLITNDKALQRKAKKIGLRSRVFSVNEAISFLSKEDDTEILKTPVIVSECFLYNIDIKDAFFNSLREDYYGFDSWLIKKMQSQEKAYVNFSNKGKVGAFLMLKIENENEEYNDFRKPFGKGRRVKVSTFKVSDRGKSIGETFIKIIVNFALKHNIHEIYVTVFEKQNELIDLLNEYGFNFYTTKKTKIANGDLVEEMVLLKNLNIENTVYPILKLSEQKIYMVPIQNQYSQMLFPEIFDTYQIAMSDLDGTSTYGNAIKKVYISRSKLKQINEEDILVFYSSEVKKSVVCVGVVEDVFRANEIDDYETFVRLISRRTVFQKEYLKECFENGYLIILFKHYSNLTQFISLDVAIQNGILNGPPQSIQRMTKENFLKLVEISGSNKKIKI